MFSVPSRRILRSRLVPLVALAAGLTLVAAGCSSTASDPASTGAHPAGAGSFPVTIAHEYGSTVVPAAPKRVIALGWTDADTALALGVTPIAVEDWQQLGLKDGQVNPWAESEVNGKGPVVLPRGDLNFKEIAALHPDLILDVNGRANSSKANYTILSKIAPTIASPANEKNNNLSWQDQVAIDAAALGVPQKGKALIASTTAKLASTKQANPQLAGKTTSLDWAVQNGWHSYVVGDVRSQFAANLGLSIAPALVKVPSDDYFATLSIEQTPLIQADVVVLVAFARSAASIEAEPAVKALPAYKSGHVVVLDNAKDAELRAAFATGSTLSIDYSLEKLTPRLVQAAEGHAL